MALASRDKVTFILSPAIETFGYWVEQLIAESTGKNGRGIVPVEGDLANLKGRDHQARAPTALYVYLKLGDDTTHDRLVASLKRAKLPVIELRLGDVYDLGAEFFRWEFATAIAGVVLGVNPFDEPNVTESKNNTKRLLDEYEVNGAFSTEQSSKSANAQLNKFLRGCRDGDYVAVQAYLPYTERAAAELLRMRAAIGARGPACPSPSATGRASCTAPASCTRAAPITSWPCNSPTTSKRMCRSPASRTRSAR